METPLTEAALDAEVGDPESMAVLQLCRQLERRLIINESVLRVCIAELPDRCEHERELARIALGESACMNNAAPETQSEVSACKAPCSDAAPFDIEGPDTHFLCR